MATPFTIQARGTRTLKESMHRTSWSLAADV